MSPNFLRSRRRVSRPRSYPIMNALIRPLMKFSHSKIGWFVNKISLGVSGWLLSVGIDSGEIVYQIIAGIGALLFLAIEFGVKLLADRFVDDFQHKHGLTVDSWPGLKTRLATGVEKAPVYIQPD